MPLKPEFKIVGIDFDNTIACYDTVFATTAIQNGLLEEGFSGSKKMVRDTLRQKPGGELEWQRLQGMVYGKNLPQATMYPGVMDFLKACKDHGFQARIVSHKTQTNKFDLEQINLRKAAFAWLEGHRIFSDPAIGMRPEHVYFEDDRLAKIERIRVTGCSIFIDDLVEVFEEPSFPADVERILFSPANDDKSTRPYPVLPSWNQITELVLKDGDGDG